MFPRCCGFRLGPVPRGTVRHLSDGSKAIRWRRIFAGRGVYLNVGWEEIGGLRPRPESSEPMRKNDFATLVTCGAKPHECEEDDSD